MTNNGKVQELLNNMVATEAVFMFKMYHRHFYVKGSHFFILHEKFEDLYEEAADHFDELAERLLAIGGHPYSSMAQFLEHSILKEDPKQDVSDMDMVKGTVEDLQAICDNLAKGIDVTGEAGDDTTQDMLIAYKMVVDKHIWMLTAFLGQEVKSAE